ncbi:gamma carbonic anhydrase family protein [Metaclostridioides mangenotii]|jgi:carbonic anhydrase/acetyltransferase-like protein (isoleucine patch superfamily)|uniref:Carbonic anhydrase/acetyltransferase-like protein (Isoleucine patch superfamily) n=1 Tax=Metaclostridioides mangenotii TaxID=1540 RepID=A0ABS4EBL4_9FIRM|nr:gamma carbonic anhydrase family protein [Clostridioides mangenotii]MBP1855323.1 carbonic anhydrase/acetyltransferase-like protein (isoleucine patch superfamily) [Clostridioides mangenotii]
MVIRDFKGINPEIGENVFISETASIIGDVKIGKNCSIWYNSVLRGDGEAIVIGDNSNIQDGVVLHGDYITKIGNNVTVGHKALVHGATVGDNTLIGMGAIVLDNAVIGANSIVAAGSVVTSGKTFPDGVLLMGIPAKVVRELTKEDIEGNKSSAKWYVDTANGYK